MKTLLTLTDAAVARVTELLAREPGAAALRMGVDRKGCNGFGYTFDYASSLTGKETLVEQDGAKVAIDPAAELYVAGSTLDWVDDGLAQKFVVSNPNAKGACGCGESFSV